MTTAAIRERLHDYISVADDKNLEAIYTLLEDKMNRAVDDWSNDKDFLIELDSRVELYENGTDRGYTWNELEQAIEELKKAPHY